MKSITELKSKALMVNRVCFIFVLIVGFFANIGLYDFYFHYVHDVFGTFYSAAKGWGIFLVILGIAVHVLFATLGYYLIKLFIQTRRNEVEE